MTNKYWHITPVKNQVSIQRDGLCAGECGEIFVFNAYKLFNPANKKKVLVADAIALNQIGIDSYCVFEISVDGIIGKVIPDNVAEYTRDYQFIIKQLKIDPIYIKFLGIRKTNIKAPVMFLSSARRSIQ